MSDASFASLNPTLLARKGGAKPAMRPHLGAVPGMGVAGNAAPNLDDLDDLGWNDMGEDHQTRESDVVHLTPAPANEEAAVEAAANDAEAQFELTGAPAKPAVHKQQEAIAEKLGAEPAEKSPALIQDNAPDNTIAAPPVTAAPAAPPAPAKREKQRKSAAANGRRAAFTLRLDAQRHLKLRLASTIKGRSAQALVTQALDALLADMEDLDSLAAQVNQGSNQTKLNTASKEGTEA